MRAALPTIIPNKDMPVIIFTALLLLLAKK
jgi:hypothetical protein